MKTVDTQNDKKPDSYAQFLLLHRSSKLGGKPSSSVRLVFAVLLVGLGVHEVAELALVADLELDEPSFTLGGLIDDSWVL